MSHIEEDFAGNVHCAGVTKYCSVFDVTDIGEGVVEICSGGLASESFSPSFRSPSPSHHSPSPSYHSPSPSYHSPSGPGSLSPSLWSLSPSLWSLSPSLMSLSPSLVSPTPSLSGVSPYPYPSPSYSQGNTPWSGGTHSFSKSPSPSASPYPYPSPSVSPYPYPSPSVSPYPYPSPSVSPYPYPSPSVSPYPYPSPSESAFGCPTDNCDACATTYYIDISGLATCDTIGPFGNPSIHTGTQDQTGLPPHDICQWSFSTVTSGNYVSYGFYVVCEAITNTWEFSMHFKKTNVPMREGFAQYNSNWTARGNGDCPNGVYNRTSQSCTTGTPACPATLTVY